MQFCRHSVENGSRKVLKWWKIFRGKMMKFGRKIFSGRGLPSTPGTLTGPSRDIPDNLYRILVINFRYLVVNIFGTFHVKVMNVGRNVIFTKGFYNTPGTLVGHSRDYPERSHWIFTIYTRVVENTFACSPKYYEISSILVLIDVFFNRFVELQFATSFTSLLGGKQVDGLPPASIIEC